MVDLHTHTTASDGSDTPRELVEKAEAAGLSAIALTDHNSMDGVAEFLEAAKGKKLRAIPGTEFSTEYQGVELHIVALFLPPEAEPEIRELTEEFHRQKIRCNRLLAENLAAAGYAITYEEVERMAKGYVNRAHFATLLTNKGYVKDRQEAFAKLLGEGDGFYTAPKRPDVFAVIRLVRRYHGVPVLAHPYLNLTQEALEGFLPRAIEAGLLAMETRYTTYDEATTALARATAKRFGLLESGGSDYHGVNKPDTKLGTGKGNLAVPDEIFQALLAKSQEI